MCKLFYAYYAKLWFSKGLSCFYSIVVSDLKTTSFEKIKPVSPRIKWKIHFLYMHKMEILPAIIDGTIKYCLFSALQKSIA